MRRIFTALLSGVFLAGTALSAMAEKGWVGQITPYVWASGIGGEITPFSSAGGISFNRSFSDLLEDVDDSFFLSGYARRGRFVILGDFSYSSSSREGNLLSLPAKASLRQRSTTLTAGWRAIDNEAMTLDLLTGARIWSIKSKVAVASGAMVVSDDRDFTDPIVALRVNAELAPRWSAIAYLDVGGYGVGSKHTSQILLVGNYKVTGSLYVSAGYSRLDVDYKDGGTQVDVWMAGPLLGVTWNF